MGFRRMENKCYLICVPPHDCIEWLHHHSHHHLERNIFSFQMTVLWENSFYSVIKSIYRDSNPREYLNHKRWIIWIKKNYGNVHPTFSFPHTMKTNPSNLIISLNIYIHVINKPNDATVYRIQLHSYEFHLNA